MLSKLLKYDLKKNLKFLSIFYIITVVLSVLTRLFINTASPIILMVIGKIFSGALISLFASILINAVMGLWIKSFARGVYGDESYLTHTLPVTKTQIYLSKFLTTIIVAAVSICVIICAAFIAYYTEERWAIVKFYLSNSKLFVLLGAISIFLEFINLIQCGFTGIILGHRQNRGKVGFSVLFSAVAETVTQVIVLIFTACAALFSSDFRMLFKTNAIPTEGQLHFVFALEITVYVLIIVFNALLNIKLLNKGVDVE